jgi:uncharacterized coiled-coil protein SlyX
MDYGRCARCDGEIMDGTSKEDGYHKYVEDCVAYQNKLISKLALNLVQHQLLIDGLTEGLGKMADIVEKFYQPKDKK